MQKKDYPILRSCPFCGSLEIAIASDEGTVTRHNTAFGDLTRTVPSARWAYCCTCGCSAPSVKVKNYKGWYDEKEQTDALERAIDAWNRRTAQESELPASSTPTNAQRIRSMSDEELQKFLLEFESGDIDYAKTFCDLCCKDAALERRSVDCEGCLLWWLKNDATLPQGLDYWTKQPAETEGTE
jgi:hypothetical protein